MIFGAFIAKLEALDPLARQHQNATTNASCRLGLAGSETAAASSREFKVFLVFIGLWDQTAVP